MDNEGFLMATPRRTRKPSSWNSQETPATRAGTIHWEYQYQLALADHQSRDSEGAPQVPANYGATKRNDRNYSLAKRTPSFHRSPAQTPAKTDDHNIANSADGNSINNNKINYYNVLEFEDDEAIDDNVAKIVVTCEGTKQTFEAADKKRTGLQVNSQSIGADRDSAAINQKGGNGNQRHVTVSVRPSLSCLFDESSDTTVNRDRRDTFAKGESTDSSRKKTPSFEGTGVPVPNHSDKSYQHSPERLQRNRPSVIASTSAKQTLQFAETRVTQINENQEAPEKFRPKSPSTSLEQPLTKKVRENTEVKAGRLAITAIAHGSTTLIDNTTAKRRREYEERAALSSSTTRDGTAESALRFERQTFGNRYNKGTRAIERQPIDTLQSKLFPKFKGLRNLNRDRTKTSSNLTVLKRCTTTTDCGLRQIHNEQKRPPKSSNPVRTFTVREYKPSVRNSQNSEYRKKCKRRKRLNRNTLHTKHKTIMQSAKDADEGDSYTPMIVETQEAPSAETEESRGLTDKVDLTDTGEEVIFKTARKTTNPIAYVHDEVTAPKKHQFPKGFINDGRETIIDTEEDDYCYLTQTTVRVQSSKPTIYRTERVLYGILLALQHCDPTARLVVWKHDDEEDVSTANQVRRCSDLTSTNVNDFIEEPRTNSKTHSFSGRICLLSEYSLIEMKQDAGVRAWLNKERVYLSENKLATATTAAVGIITGWTPRNLAAVHIARIRKEIATAPDFLVEYKWLSDGSHVKAKFIVVRAAQRDVSKLEKRLTETNGKTDFKFHPWDHIMSLSKQQKRHFIQTELIFQQQNYSLLIKDLRSGIDDLPMRYKETTIRDRSQTVRAFLLEHYKTWDQQRLFKMIHKEAAGIIEILVTAERFIEAKRCVEHIRLDLSHYMSEAARKAAFDDFKLLNNRGENHIPWTAMDLSGYAASVNHKPEPTLPKRQRTDTSISTYSNVTKNSTLQISGSEGGGRCTPASSVTAMEPALDTKPLLELQSKNNDLEHKVTELEEIVRESQASIKSSFETMMSVMNQKNIARDNEIDDKVSELESWVKQSQVLNTQAIRDLTQEVSNNDGVIKHLMTNTIPALQQDVQNTKSILENKMDDGFSGIRNMFQNMMNQQGNSLHRADGGNQQDVTLKRNRSASKSRKSQDSGSKSEKNRADSTIRRRSGDSRDNDNLDELTHSDHQMHGTGDQS
jgi:hypothetical protein